MSGAVRFFLAACEERTLFAGAVYLGELWQGTKSIRNPLDHRDSDCLAVFGVFGRRVARGQYQWFRLSRSCVSIYGSANKTRLRSGVCDDIPRLPEEYLGGTVAYGLEAIVPTDWGAIGPVTVVQTMTQWPAKQPSDLGWVYVSIGGDVYSEAVIAIITLENGRPKVREVEFGRP
jgi:hypothetical protein